MSTAPWEIESLLGAAGRPGMARRVKPRVRDYLADALTPLAVYRRLSALSPYRFLFESVSGGEHVSRYSLLGAGASEVVRLWPHGVEIERDGKREWLAENQSSREVLAAFAGRLSALEAEPGASAHAGPLAGGWVGFFGFDLVRLIERLPGRSADPYGLPLAVLLRADQIVVFDHAQQRVLAIANEVEGEISALEAERRLDELEAVLTSGGSPGAVRLPARHGGLPSETRASLSGEQYRRAVEVAKEHIAAGDIFQVVLARRFSLPRAVDPLTLYRAVRWINPSPYMVLFETPEVALVGASPEMLVKKTGRRLETRPIAGTRPRGATPEADRALAESLLADPKERAEHVMLVDLGRNDLGRVARAGTVRAASFMEVERYSHVMHLVSSVLAELPPERAGIGGALSALLAAFPAGTVSGAPKIRAMEILDELEPEARGPYAGAVGYLSYTGDLDTCITIRTLVVKDGVTSVTAGAGIVADSDPRSEECETENKAAALLAAVALAEEMSARENEREGKRP